jgi:para-nitrobenzyl esterase
MNDPMQALAQAETGGEKFAGAVGASALADLRMAASTELVRIMGSNAIAFGLRPNVDGHVLPHDMPEIIASHQDNGAELLIGTNYDEGTELLPATTPEALAALAHRRFGAQGDGVAGLYNGADADRATVAQDRMQSDYLLAASVREALVYAERGQPAYVYRFTRLAPGSDPLKVGAFHSAELAYVFGTQASIERPWTARGGELSQQMQQYWTNFAKSGNPNGEGVPAWPRFAAAEQQVMELGDVTRPIPVLDPQRRCSTPI